RAVYLGRTHAVEVGPDDQALDLDADLDAVVEHLQPPVPERAGVDRSAEALPRRPDRARVVLDRLAQRRRALDQHVLAAVAESVRAGVVGEGDLGALADAVELAPRGHRAVHRAQGAGLAVTQPE